MMHLRKKSGGAAAICTAVALSLIAPRLFAQGYTVTDLGTLGGTSGTYAYGINDSGEVVGYSYTTSGAQRAFLYNNGTMQNLGALSGATGLSEAQGINSSGAVVGTMVNSTGTLRAFLYENGTVHDLGSLGGAAGESEGYAINGSFEVVGDSSIASGGSHPFLYNNTMQDLGSLSTRSPNGALGINDSGEVVGYSYTASGVERAFLYNGTMQDLGSLGGADGGSCAYGINNGGEVVGVSDTSSDGSHAFLYKNGTMQDLGTLIGVTGFSEAEGINNSGEVVGWSDTTHTAQSGVQDAFVDMNGKMTDLNIYLPQFTGIHLDNATGVNDEGQIIVNGTDNGQDCAFLLTPNEAPGSAPDTGATLVLLLGSVAGLSGWSAWRR
jgi:probable HAF family extracellular repeat protein